MNHIPRKVWQEKAGEISWRCSCGTQNKHIPLPAELVCLSSGEFAHFLLQDRGVSESLTSECTDSFVSKVKI